LKNYLPIVATMPDFLKPYLFAYRQDHRPELLAGSTSDAVWIGSRHDELNYGAIAYLFTSIGKRLLGYPINCHSFRHSTATSIMTKDPRNIGMASGVLSHREPEVVRKHYDLSGDAASRQAWEKLRRDIMRGKSLKQP
jgi:integrase